MNINTIPIIPTEWRRLILFALMGVFIVTPALASIVEESLPSGTIVGADYRPGKSNLPAVLLIHGFLQTRDFPTVAHLADGLSAAGYTTLTPTLSLGISHRIRSLPCEAIHQHSMEQDVSEIRFWANWLAQRQHTKIILIGHSYGSLQSIIYGIGHPNPAIQQIIALSLTDADFHVTAANKKTLIKYLKEQSARHNTDLVKHQLGYCKTYISPPENSLSYIKWDRPQILNALSRSHIPLTVIMGSTDDRMGPDWPNLIRKQGTDVKIIKGANHFFDNQYEFDLLDLTLSSIRRHQKVH